jgi:hypothetical protein
VFAGAAAKEDANAETFLVVRGHGMSLLTVISCQFSVISEKTELLERMFFGAF